jgi:CDP-diacylglycerol pyrophosphatase
VPDTDVTGIGDPRALRPPVVAFWRYGWQAGQQLLDEPPERIGLAINSRAGRSQDLLHIHISCVADGLQQVLGAAAVGPDWATAPFVRFAGQTFNARRAAALDQSPFLVLRALPAARAEMGARSLAVVGRADGGFFLLTSATVPGVAARAEALLDQSCG